MIATFLKAIVWGIGLVVGFVAAPLVIVIGVLLAMCLLLAPFYGIAMVAEYFSRARKRNRRIA